MHLIIIIIIIIIKYANKNVKIIIINTIFFQITHSFYLIKINLEQLEKKIMVVPVTRTSALLGILTGASI